MSKLELEELRSLPARKIFHVIFVAFLAVPFLADIPAELYISLLTLASAVLYSIQVRQPATWQELREGFFKALEDAFRRLEEILPLDQPQLKAQYQKALRQFEELIIAAERDYEKRHGYLGILMGTVGVLTAMALFGKQHLPPAIISLAVYDAVSAVVGTVTKGRRYGKITLWGTAAGTAANAVALAALGYPLHGALLITLLVVLADALSPEDNLTIPIAASAGSYLLAAL